MHLRSSFINKIFERGLIKNLKKSNFIFVFELSVFFLHYCKKQKEPGSSYQFSSCRIYSELSFSNFDALKIQIGFWVIQKIAISNLDKPIHFRQVFHFYNFLLKFLNVGQVTGELQNFEYLYNENRILSELKSIFNNFFMGFYLVKHKK